ncbi:MAG: phenylalanine--tRNA ligase subunit alpha [Spirochaetia bacterium]|nr:phenylalanine--tRNA ligase subunit alpha [Spirochaetia bacterium]
MALLSQIESLGARALDEVAKAESPADIETLEQTFLGKKGELTAILKGLKDLTPDERRTAGQAANDFREKLESSIRERRAALQELVMAEKLKSERFDALRPAPVKRGRMHPITRVQYEIEDIFTAMGFRVMDGPEVETDENNFGRLNFSDDHPARDMQDTIWTEDGNLLRTHTSSIQVRSMSLLKPPFRIIAPGRCFRYEETDASHENTFYQCEGMMVDKEISVAHLIHVMKAFLRAFFERDVKVRLRPGFFPFVEPGFELDMGCLICGGKGCSVCKHSGWVEVLPCGLVHPNVLKAGGIDPKKWQGFAFGMGLSRLVMMRHGIEDIRHFLSGNMRFLTQF